MESNHRFLGVGQVSLPLDHGTVFVQVESPGVAPGSPACGAGVVLLDHDPKQAEAVGLEPTSGCWPPPVFKTGSSSGRMTSVAVKSCGGWNRTNMKTFRASHPAVR